MTPEPPLISIALCTYNGETFLREQLDSLVAQDYPHLEIIAVDDGSRDSTPQILAAYAAQHAHFQYLKNEQNLGFRRNFEKALSLCNGEWIALCDQDDIWFPQKISTLAKHIGSNSLIYSMVQLIDSNGDQINQPFPRVNLLEGHCALSLLFENCVTGHACMIHNDLLPLALPIPENVPYHDHWIAVVAATQNGIKLHREILSLYRQHEANVALTKEKRSLRQKATDCKTRFKNRMAFFDAVMGLPGLSTEDRQLVAAVQRHYRKYPYCFGNNSLKKLLKRHSNQLLPLHYNPEKTCGKLCRGRLRDLL